MTDLLLVDDSRMDRLLIRETLAGLSGLEIREAVNGVEALASIRERAPDIILTDLVMPEKNGLELTREVHASHPGIPVILLTAQGSEEIAVQAFAAGAASYVPKRILAHDLLDTVLRVLDASRREREQETLRRAVVERRARFRLSHDGRLASALVAHLQDIAEQMGLCDETCKMQIGVALSEAICNAAQHGNLELASALRDNDPDCYQRLLAERSGQEPYRSRVIHVEALFTREQVQFVIRDEGHGFDPEGLPDPRDPENLQKASGRGVFLMRAFMDEVHFNPKGNEVTLVKRRS